MKTGDNIIKNLNSILSEQTMNSSFNDTDITILVHNIKDSIIENIKNKYDNESEYFKEEVNSLNKYIELNFEDETIAVINKFLGSKDDKYCWDFVTAFAFSSSLRNYLNNIKFDSYDASVESPDNIDELKYFMRQTASKILFAILLKYVIIYS